MKFTQASQITRAETIITEPNSPRSTLYHPLIPILKRNCLFSFLICIAFVTRGDSFFLRNGELSVFDGQQAGRVKPQSALEHLLHLHDWKKGPAGNQFLLSKKHDTHYVPDSDARSGFDLWVRDSSGAERLLNASVYRAKFSPDARRIAYTTTDCVLHVEDLAGKKALEVDRAYNPSWRRDGKEILFEKVPARRNVHYPETLQLAKLDVATGRVDLLTDGSFDDVRPEFHPSGKWVMFVSGGRTGLASFWQMDVAGGKPSQVTNIGRRRVDENFVPTPYRQTIWSADGRWFLYDFKNGETRQAWGLEFSATGKLLRTIKLGDGLNPQWVEDGKSFVYLKQTSEGDEPVVGVLP